MFFVLYIYCGFIDNLCKFGYNCFIAFQSVLALFSQVMAIMDMDGSPTNFLRDDSNNPLNSPEAQIINCRVQLEDLRDLFNFKMDLRKLKTTNIDTLERELRRILAVIYSLRGMTERSNLLASSDAVIQSVNKVLDNLYAADNLLIKPKLSFKRSKDLYPLLRSCGGLLEEALEYFLV